MAKAKCKCFPGVIVSVQDNCVLVKAREGRASLKVYCLRDTPIKVGGKVATLLSLAPGIQCDVWMTLQDSLLGLDCREKIPEIPKILK